MQPGLKSHPPGICQLEAMPGIFRALLGDATDQDASWKPSPVRWCILEVLGHLSHVEVHGFRARARLILDQDNPVLENYDPDAHLAAGAYFQPSLASALETYERERTRSVELLRSITAEAVSRPAIHDALGPITLRDLLNEWPFHDIGHLRQICELLRAVRFYPHIGVWQQFYTLKP
jgi:hypothetical protein